MKTFVYPLCLLALLAGCQATGPAAPAQTKPVLSGSASAQTAPSPGFPDISGLAIGDVVILTVFGSRVDFTYAGDDARGRRLEAPEGKLWFDRNGNQTWGQRAGRAEPVQALAWLRPDGAGGYASHRSRDPRIKEYRSVDCDVARSDTLTVTVSCSGQEESGYIAKRTYVVDVATGFPLEIADDRGGFSMTVVGYRAAGS